MNHNSRFLKRTKFCGTLTSEDIGKTMILNGWVHRRRDLGGLIFVDLRDRTGLVQLVFNPEPNFELFKLAESLRNEYVIAVKGKVNKRPIGTDNPNLATGEVEVYVEELQIINASKPSPISIAEDKNEDEAFRMKYRYLDLRRPAMQKNLIIRYKFNKALRDFLELEGFIEVETPTMLRSTPEGARDYLVPSRLNPGKFYALAQSPQLLKQLLMVSGFERYFQMARCYRDEDLRADRQPEFTQVDIEMSFIERDDLFDVIERMLNFAFKKTLNIDIPIPFPRMTYQEAMQKYGSDKPDMRFDLHVEDLSEWVKDTDFTPFKDALSQGGKIKGFNIPLWGEFSRKNLDTLTEQARRWGAQNLFALSLTQEGIKSSLSKVLPEETLKGIAGRFQAKTSDLILMVADADIKASEILGRLRLEIAASKGLIPKDKFIFYWVVDFPMFRYNEEENKFDAEHHPFTSPLPEDMPLLDCDPAKVRAAAYDLVLNGYEVGSGSIRIHNKELQKKIFKLLSLTEQELEDKFGFLLQAFEYGAPPHGGIALGLDRLSAIIAGVDNIREVLAFPKNLTGVCPLTNTPTEVSSAQLEALRIQVVKEDKP
jgi:aspartyl-tRNA synthetase